MTEEELRTQTRQQYADIIDLPYPPESRGKGGLPMPMSERAGQFSPFAALHNN